MNSPLSKLLFNSFLKFHLQAYLKFKQSLGYTHFSRTSEALDLDRYLLFRAVTSVQQIDEGLIVNWIHSVPKLSPATKNCKLTFARGFFRYLMRIGIAQDNPALRIRYIKQNSYKPYVYTLKEIQKILEATKKIQHKYPHRLLGWTLGTMIFLIYACGLRLS